jgi:hypothetical protein
VSNRIDHGYYLLQKRPIRWAMRHRGYVPCLRERPDTLHERGTTTGSTSTRVCRRPRTHSAARRRGHQSLPWMAQRQTSRLASGSRRPSSTSGRWTATAAKGRGEARRRATYLLGSWPVQLQSNPCVQPPACVVYRFPSPELVS